MDKLKYDNYRTCMTNTVWSDNTKWVIYRTCTINASTIENTNSIGTNSIVRQGLPHWGVE